MEDEDQPTRVGVALLAAVTAVLLAAVYWLCVRPVWDAVRSESWPEARCTVTRHEVVQSTDSDGDPSWSAPLAYSYEYDGRPRVGSDLTFSRETASADRAKWTRQVADFPVGSTHPCWVDPADPDRAVLDRSLTSALSMLQVVVLLVTAGFAVGTARGIRRLRR